MLVREIFTFQQFQLLGGALILAIAQMFLRIKRPIGSLILASVQLNQMTGEALKFKRLLDSQLVTVRSIRDPSNKDESISIP